MVSMEGILGKFSEDRSGSLVIPSAGGLRCVKECVRGFSELFRNILGSF